MNKFEDRLKSISDNLSSIRNIAMKYISFGFIEENGEFRIYNRTWIAPLNYAIYLFDKTPQTFFEKYNSEYKKDIPNIYKTFLNELNGCNVFDLSLYGLTPSIYEKGIIDRSKVQCYDLGTANKFWKNEFEIDKNMFHFGSRSYSFDENIGYFLDSTDCIKSILKNGEIVNQWYDFSTFLSDEIDAAEQYEKTKNYDD